MRYAISSQPELWVRCCSKFFEKHGEWEWYNVPKDAALREMIIYSKGTASPKYFRDNIENLYKSVGVK